MWWYKVYKKNAMNEITHTLKKGIFFSLWFYQFFIVECIAGYYGLECKSKCVGHCKDNKQCNHINGTCDDGCKDGYTGSDCTEGCCIFFFFTINVFRHKE